MLTFARTKIQPPRPRPGALLLRPTLQQRLVEAMQSRALVLLCATAGFGKTSTLTQAIDALPSGTAVAWVACDEGDSPLHLLSCLVAALEPYDLPWRMAPEALMGVIASNDGTPAGRLRAHRTIVAELVNALDSCDVPHGVIMVDDLHRIEHAAVFEFLDLLLERLTPRWTLAIATRHEPPLALARLRAQDALAEFRLEDLRFDDALTRSLAAASGLDASAAEALQGRTHGWPAGLQLALSVLRSRPGATLAGSSSLIDRQLFDFLAAEVLMRLAPELRNFLVMTSVLPELSAARCAALTGDDHAAERLEAIERAGLFVTLLPEPEPTLRLHDLFRDALEQRLLRERAQELPALLRRAAASEPDGLRRLGYLLRASAWLEAAAELHRQAPALLTAGANAVVQRLIERFPQALQGSVPDLAATRSLLGWAQWQWAAMLDGATRAAAGFDAAGRPLDSLAARSYASIALRASGRREASDQLVEHLQHEVDGLLAQRTDEFARGVRYDGNEPGMVAAMLATMSKVWAIYDDARLDAMPSAFARQLDVLEMTTGREALLRMLPLPAYVGIRGMQPQLERYVRLASARMGDVNDHLRNVVQGLDGSLRVWSGDVAGGRAVLREAALDTRWQGFQLRATLHTFVVLLAADALAGDVDALAQDMAEFETAMQIVRDQPELAHRVNGELHVIGRWLFAGGLIDRACEIWRSIEGWTDVRERHSSRVQRVSISGYLALAEGRDAEAEHVFAQALAEHGAGLDLFGQSSELRLRLAGLRLRLRRPLADAASVLRPLFDRHAHDVDIAAVWMVGSEQLSALAQAAWGDQLDAVDVRTLQRWSRGALQARGQSFTVVSRPAQPQFSTGASGLGPAGSPQPQPPMAIGVPALGRAAAGPVLPALSEREFEVLRCIAAGDSNKLIARRFDLSHHTVKRHVANILDKLDLRSRGQAAAWYHAHCGEK